MYAKCLNLNPVFLIYSFTHAKITKLPIKVIYTFSSRPI